MLYKLVASMLITLQLLVLVYVFQEKSSFKINIQLNIQQYNNCKGKKNPI